MNDPLDLEAGTKTIPVRAGQGAAALEQDATALEITPPPQKRPARPPAPVEPPPPAAPAETVCPRCGGKLVNPEGLGWCLSCGYCRSTAEEKGSPPPPPETAGARSAGKHSALGAVEFFQIVRRLPRWFWLLVFGVTAIVHLSIFANLQLPPEGRARAVWSTAQIGAALALAFVAQLWALAMIAPHDERLTARDALIPFRLWNITIRWLPKSCWPVCLGAWALTLLLCAVTLVGGLGYWLPKPPQKVEVRPVREWCCSLPAQKTL